MAYVVAALSVAVVVLTALLVGVLQSHAQILRALHDVGIYADGRPSAAGPPPGDPSAVVPARRGRHLGAVEGTTPDGESVSLPLEGERRPTMLAFLTTGCVTCSSFWAALDRRRALPGVRVVVVTRGAEAESPEQVARLRPRDTEVVMSTAMWEQLAVPGAPYFIQVEAGEIVAEGVATSWEQLLQLLSRASTERAPSTHPTRRELLHGGRRPARADRVVEGHER